MRFTLMTLVILAASTPGPVFAQGSGIGSNGVVGTIDPNNTFKIVGTTLNASDFNNPGSWSNAVVCSDSWWGIKNHTGAIPGRSWINATGVNTTINHLLIATPFNPGSLSSVSISVTFGVDDALQAVYVNGIGNSHVLSNTGNHSLPTTFTWNNVVVNPNTTNWLYFHQIDTARVASGFIYDARVVPEPGTLLALGTAATALVAKRRRKAKPSFA